VLSDETVIIARQAIELAASRILPIFWPPSFQPVASATAFVLDCGSTPFLVTADHVVTGFEQFRDQSTGDARFQVGRLVLDLDSRILARDADLDLATIDITKKELNRLGITSVIAGDDWPPPPPKPGDPLFFSGYPGKEREKVDDSLGFGIFSGCFRVNGTSSRHISLMLETCGATDLLGLGLPPDDYPIGGLSGTPLFGFVQPLGVLYWRLVGVLTEGEWPIVLAARAGALGPGGQIGPSIDL
jgi:hypothetical protein